MDFLNLFKNINRILIIGAGSGRDIASAVIVKELFPKRKFKIDIAGFLTPWAIHFINDKIEQPVNDVTSVKKAKKVILKTEETLDSFFEPYLKKIFEDYKVCIEKVYVFSLHYGFTKLFHEFLKLIKINKYDAIIAVDVGGDIIGEEEDYFSLLTPLVDWTCLELLKMLPNSLKKYIAIVSPGVCGEISYYRIRKLLKDIENRSLNFFKLKFDKNSSCYQKFYHVNKSINEKYHLYSHTVEMINKLINSSVKREKFVYKKIYKINKKTFEVPFEVCLERNLVLSIYFFDLCSIKHFFFKKGYKNLTEAFISLKNKKICGTELDFSVIPNKYINEKENLVYFLTPCCYTKNELRKKLIEVGVEEVLENHKIKSIIINKMDLEKIDDQLKNQVLKVFKKDFKLQESNLCILKRE